MRDPLNRGKKIGMNLANIGQFDPENDEVVSGREVMQTDLHDDGKIYAFGNNMGILEFSIGK